MIALGGRADADDGRRPSSSPSWRRSTVARRRGRSTSARSPGPGLRTYARGARRHRRAEPVPRQPLDLHARRLRRPRRPAAARPATSCRIGDERRRAPAAPGPLAAGHGPGARRSTGSSACWSARTPRPSSSPPTGLDELLRADVDGALQLGPHRRAPRSARSRRGRAPTAATPACTRRTSTTPATRSARSTSPATCRSSSAPTARASAGSCARPSWPPRERWKLGQLRPGDRVRLVCPCRRPAPPSPTASGERGSRRATDARSSRSPGRRGTRRSPPAGPGRRGSAARRRRLPTQRRRRPPGRHLSPGRRPLPARRVRRPMTLDLELRGCASTRSSGGSREHSRRRRRRHRRRALAARPGRRRPCAPCEARSARCGAAEDELGERTEMRQFPSRVVHLPLSWDDPATREAIDRYMHGVRADAPWCPWNIEFIRRINGLDVGRRRPTTSCSTRRYLVLGLGDVYLGAPVATPLDPRHRLVTTKYNPARTWTPENAVGIGGAYLCIYGMEGPGGYQFVGRTVQVWNRDRRGPHFDRAVAAAHLRPDPFPPGRRRRAARAAGAHSRAASWRCGSSRRCSAWPSSVVPAEQADEIAAFRRAAAGGVRRGAASLGRRR